MHGVIDYFNVRVSQRLRKFFAISYRFPLPDNLIFHVRNFG